MPRLRGKYDHLTVYPREFRLERNFFEPVEELARRDPLFAARLSQLRKEADLKRWQEKQRGGNQERLSQIRKEASNKIWREVVAVLNKRSNLH